MLRAVAKDPNATTIAVGEAVTGGGASRVLYEDASQNLATEAAFGYNESTNTLTAENVSSTILTASSYVAAPMSGSVTNVAYNLMQNGTARWNVSTAASFVPENDNTAGASAIGSTSKRISAGVFGPGTAGAGGIFSAGANGQSLRLTHLTELTTIAASPTTDTTIQMPAGSIVLGVSVRVTVAIPTAATFTVGDSGTADRFNTGASVLVAANTTNAGTKAGAYYNASALSVRITPDLTPGANTGRVRVTIYYLESTPPTS